MTLGLRGRAEGTPCACALASAKSMLRFCVLVVAIGFTHTQPLRDGALTTTINPHDPWLTTTATATTSTTYKCGIGVAQCLSMTQCARCLVAINTTAGFPHTFSEYASFTRNGHIDRAAVQGYTHGFFQTLQQNPSCSMHATPPALLQAALQELTQMPCVEANGMVISDCLVTEYDCFLDDVCRPCLAAIYASFMHTNISKAEALRSPACTSAVAPTGGRPTPSNPFTFNPALANVIGECGAPGIFPQCTFYKQLCYDSTECLPCLDTLNMRDGTGAALRCRGETSPSAQALDNVVQYCVRDSPVGCSFWRQRCADNELCSECLAEMGDGNSVPSIAADWSTGACQRALEDDVATHYLFSIFIGCPDVSSCRALLSECIISDALGLSTTNGTSCLSCLNGSAPTNSCSLFHQYFPIETVCEPCADSVRIINLIAFGTAAIGGASAIACVAVAMSIVAHDRDRVSMRDRIVVGLMVTNAAYSTANAIPLNALSTNVLKCGSFMISFGMIRFGRAWWFCGKYGLVSFELFILGASIRALLHGSATVPPRMETMMHMGCYSCGAVAFAVFYALCSDINAAGYNTRTDTASFTNTFNHVHDDLDDDLPSLTASSEFQNARIEYDKLVRDMLIAWDVLVGVAVGLWVLLRLLHRRIVQQEHAAAMAEARAEAMDVWVDTRRSAWAARRILSQARKETFSEIARPLEPYIAVFVVFAAPAIVMSTSWCQTHSGAVATATDVSNAYGYAASNNFTYGTCDVWCEFVLAFRSLATIAVYLLPRERRVELMDVRSTCRKFCARMIGSIRCRRTPFEITLPLGDNSNGEHEMLMLVPQDHIESDSNSDSAATHDTSGNIDEKDVIIIRRLGQGAFGEVWEGVLKPEGRKVAIKTLFSGAVDNDGDLVDPAAATDFRKECAALQQIDSPHLISFYGFGTTRDGYGFIVTELMCGGSLQDVLHDYEQDMSWNVRVSIALQIALGMDHLHERHMLHRDLKSANVLVNEQHTIAKVCDFGLSRVVKPVREHILMYSPFTGVMRWLPRADGVVMSGGQRNLSLTNVAMCIEDERGKMTRGAGTLVWMAPEVFRGDQVYTNAVDVYSFGIVLWELATRETPWAEIQGNEAVFFPLLNKALQTGRRPTIPTIVLAEHANFVEIMRKCWAGDPADRPAFSEAAAELAAYLRQLV